MSKELIVNNVPFEYPTPGDPPGWGDAASDWATEVTKVLTGLFGPNDILETVGEIANNQVSFIDIPGLLFDPSSVRSASIEMNIYRVTDSVQSGNVANIVMYIVYDNSANSNEKWKYTIESDYDAGVDFQILDSGQVQYTSTNISGTNYNGIIKFKAKTMSQDV